MANATPQTERVAVAGTALVAAGAAGIACAVAAATGSLLVVGILLGGLQLALWLAYRQFLDAEVQDSSSSPTVRFKPRLLGQLTVGATMLVPLCALLVGSGRTYHAAAVGLGLCATLLLTLEATRRRFGRPAGDMATAPEQPYRVYKVAVPATLVLAAWVLAIDAIYDGELELTSVAYVAGTALTLGVAFAYLPFLAAWVLSELTEDLARKAAVVPLWCLLFAPQVVPETALSGWGPLVWGVAVTIPFIAFVEPTRRRVIRGRRR